MRFLIENLHSCDNDTVVKNLKKIKCLNIYFDHIKTSLINIKNNKVYRGILWVINGNNHSGAFTMNFSGISAVMGGSPSKASNLSVYCGFALFEG